ncbi:hypothetical protein KPH14_007045 [Odynerus spinipes]|uniref:G patch domain-containing protein 4 n=1 Tax=Odynerus spinipes TaxID=1348599 RepID=A0AAD9RRR0_9HYME|nr:hypothetical protein KPH14_007045 [Odynerus spinipes]
MANFAKAQLLKYGWTEGKGLGKNENGITEALKPKLKFNTEGLGHKSLEEVNWWESAYNNAVKNVSISSENDEVAISVTDKNASSIMEKNLKGNQSSQEQYNSFRKTCMLQDEKLIMLKNTNEKEEEEEKPINKIPLLTDDELFKACGGRTAHKGARHGLSLNGKLERIARQEQKLLGLMSNLGTKEITNKSTSKIKENAIDSENEVDNNANAIAAINPPCNEEDGFVKTKTDLKKEKKRIRHLAHLLHTSCNIDENNSSLIATINKKSNLKRKRSKDRETKINIGITDDNILPTVTIREDHSMPLSTNSISEKKSKKRKKHNKRSIVKEDNNIGTHDCKTSCRDSIHNSSFQLKKKRRQNQENGEISSEAIDGDFSSKKLKCQRKIIKLMEKMSFGNSEDEHIKNEKSSSDTDLITLENTFSSKEALRLNRRTLKKKKYLHKKNKKKVDLERHICDIVTVCSQKKLDSVTENLMSADIIEDVSTKLKRSKKHAKKQKKLKRKTESNNGIENRTDI